MFSLKDTDILSLPLGKTVPFAFVMEHSWIKNRHIFFAEKSVCIFSSSVCITDVLSRFIQLITQTDLECFDNDVLVLSFPARRLYNQPLLMGWWWQGLKERYFCLQVSDKRQSCVCPDQNIFFVILAFAM